MPYADPDKKEVRRERNKLARKMINLHLFRYHGEPIVGIGTTEDRRKLHLWLHDKTECNHSSDHDGDTFLNSTEI